MASLHRDSRGKTPYWIAAYTDQFGRQRKRSTKKTDKREARIVLQGFERAEQLARNNNLTERAAREILNEILSRTGQPQIYAPSIRQYLADWLKREDSNTKIAINRKQQLVARLFLDSLRSRADIPLTHIIENDILNLRNKLVSDGRTLQTANTLVRGVLGSAFKYALEKGWISVNPVTCIKKTHQTLKTEKGTFSPEQISRMIASAQGDWKGAILFGYFSGARLSDIANLQWKNVDLSKRTLTFRQRKTGAELVIPLHDELQEYLESLPSTDSNDKPVFPSLYGRGTGGLTGLSMSFTKIMKAVGIESAALRTRSGTAGRSVNALSFHSLRHSCNSALANSGRQPGVTNEGDRPFVQGHEQHLFAPRT
jgi:integrase